MSNDRARRRTLPHVHDASCILRTALVCFHVAQGLRPVLLAWRDREDGTWALACGSDAHHGDRGDEWGMARLFAFTATEPSMGIVHTLRAGESVQRGDAQSPWRRRAPR